MLFPQEELQIITTNNTGACKDAHNNFSLNFTVILLPVKKIKKYFACKHTCEQVF